MAATRFQVFLSSTFEDLREERAVLLRALTKEFIPLGMEFFDADSDRGWRQITEDLNQADFYVLIIGYNYGTIFDGTEESWTEHEYRYATARNLQPLVFVRSGTSLPAAELDPALERFKNELRAQHHCVTWNNVHELTLAVIEALQAQIKRKGPAPPEYSSNEKRNLALLLDRLHEEKRRHLEGNKDIVRVQAEIFDVRRRLREGGRLEAGDQLSDGRFLLRRIIGQGGFATVWLAYDESTREDVAVRVLHGELARNPMSKDRFFRGTRKMLELQHPNIAVVREPRLEEDGWCYVVHPYYAEGDLRHAVIDGKYHTESALRVLLAGALGVGHAHEHGVIHRDITPSNILLDPASGGVVTDFDLVRTDDTTGGTRTGAMGKFVYVAPEALSDPRSADARSDVFSLGMTAVFCGRQGDLPPEIWKDPNQVIRQLQVNDHVKKVLQKSVSWDSRDRFSNGHEFAQNMQIALDAPSLHPIPGRRGDNRGARVLVVDDERFIRDICQDFLRMEGHSADVAATKDEALDLATRRSYDIVFLDFKIPEVRGLDLFKDIRRLAPEAAVVMITGFGTVEIAVESMKLGARDFILKPFKVEEIVDAVKTFVPRTY